MSEIFYGIANAGLLARLSSLRTRADNNDDGEAMKLSQVMAVLEKAFPDAAPEKLMQAAACLMVDDDDGGDGDEPDGDENMNAADRAPAEKLSAHSTAYDFSRGAAMRVRQIQREVLQERRRRFEQHAAIFARARGEELSPVPQSGVALQMGKLLAGQALFDPAAARILENLGLTAGSWKGLVYDGDNAAELDSATPKALDRGRREKTAAPRLRR